MLPLALLAVLAAWQLADSRKVAEADVIAETERYMKRIERRLDESLELLLGESTHWPQDTIKRQLYPMSPIPRPDSKLHERYLTLLDDRVGLLDGLPDLFLLPLGNGTYAY